MADVGTITGIVGMCTGIAGSVMGFLAYRQSGKNKVLDLRLQLRKDLNAVKAILEPLPGAMAIAKQSRGRVLAATGLGRSGNEQIFNQEWEVDRAAVDALLCQARSTNPEYSSLAGEDLELLLGEINKIMLEASRYAQKYHGAMASDDLRRSELRAEQTAIVAARMQIPLKNKLGE